MAGMFYSLKETAEKLGKTEDEVKALAQNGRLREFRDGSNLLFKIDEVNALMVEGPDMQTETEPQMDLEVDQVPEEAEANIAAEPEATPEPAEPEPEMDFDLDLEPDQAAVDSSPEPEPELDFEPAEAPEAAKPAAEPTDEDVPLELDEAEAPDLEMPAEADATSALDLAPDADEAGTAEFVADDVLTETDQLKEEPLPELGDDSISLAPETGLMGGSDITDMDTALTGEGINILGETDADEYGVTDDSLAETVGPAGTSTEASLEEIEDDVNLDSFGSGSGLLDLSLQADDTSLGGILDEIYTADSGEEEPQAGGPGSVDDLTAEAEHVGHEDELAVPEPMVAVPAMGQAYAEVPPDTQSNILGLLLFIPLLALLYTAVVAWSGQKQVMPSILQSIQGLVWYIIGGAAVLTAIVVGASFAMGAEKAPRAAKTKKAKKEKAPKEKQAKAKKEKAPKAAKPKKEKKPLFGKKK